MSDGGICAECCAACCGSCAIFASTTLGVWCGINTYGSQGCCGGSRGCCGRCCGESFDEDAFDKDIQKHLAKTRAHDAPDVPVQAHHPEQRVVTEQPTADSNTQMTLPPSKVPSP